MRAVVTGAAGFIGSHLCEHLLRHGDEVLGVDALIDTYDPVCKVNNLLAAREWQRFSFLHCDLLTADLDSLLCGADVVYHLAGEPGVRDSW